MPTYELIQDGEEYATVQAKDIHEALRMAKRHAVRDSRRLLAYPDGLSSTDFIEVGARNPKTGSARWDMVLSWREPPRKHPEVF
jgi:hypothetical protein